MFEYMDGIVDAVEEIGQAAVDNNSASMDIAVCDMEKGRKQ